jgi:hypothetical protein
MLNDVEARKVLGRAAFDCWGLLPRDVQEVLFEKAVSNEGEKIRANLALRLHEAHPRTEYS